MSDWKRKLDARGRWYIEEEDAPETVDAMLRTERALGAAERQALVAAGASVHTESGDVLTIAVRREALPAVAALEFVKRIEISRPLHAEPTD